MFEKLHDESRRAIVFARNEAIQRCQHVISVEDVVLGILLLPASQRVLMSQYEIADPLDLIGCIKAMLPVSEINQGVDLPLSPEAKWGIEEATEKAEIHVVQWFLLWVMYPVINPGVVAILEAHGITQDSLREKKLV